MRGTLSYLEQTDFPIINRNALDVLQVNLGYLCNLSCAHCHVNAGPKRTELMDKETVELVMDFIRREKIHTLDLTGGAPEMNPHFRYLVRQAREMDVSVIDRCNLVILEEPGYEDMAEFLATNTVVITASLPCYLEEDVRLQRGKGVFEKSIKTLQSLNKIGYGTTQKLPLTLVFNPLEPVLPPEQKTLENDFRKYLAEHYNIQFTRLITLTNMPIGRYLDVLKDKKSQYMTLLKQSFNPQTLTSLMCRHQINIGWDGTLYDCDFNLAASLPVTSKVPHHIQQFDQSVLSTREIITADHCFGCTAGHGSSCGGALV